MSKPKLTAYRKVLTMGKEALDASLACVRAHSALKKAELEMAKIDEQIATLTTELTTTCSEKDINFDRVIDKLNDIDLATRRREQFADIIEQMFPEAA